MTQRRTAPALALLLALAGVHPLAAQPPAPVLVMETPPPAPVPLKDADGCASPFGAVHLMLGQQTGVRVQATVLDTGEGTWVAEGFYGGLFTRIRSDEAVGFGGRYLWHRHYAGTANHVDVGPGANVFYQWDGDGQWTLVPSVDVTWHRCLGRGCGWETGMSLGVGVSLGTDGDRSPHNTVSPVISVFTGLRF